MKRSTFLGAALFVVATTAAAAQQSLSDEKLNGALAVCGQHIVKPTDPRQVRAVPPAQWTFEADWAACAALRDEYLRRINAATDAQKKQQVLDAAGALQGAQP